MIYAYTGSPSGNDFDIWKCEASAESGKGRSISVEKSEVKNAANAADDVSWLSGYANNVISDCIKKYSNIAVVERRYEDAVTSSLAHEEKGAYSDDAVEIGQFKSARSQARVISSSLFCARLSNSSVWQYSINYRFCAIYYSHSLTFGSPRTIPTLLCDHRSKFSTLTYIMLNTKSNI